MERVLVTGANSFLGTNVVVKLKERGYVIRALIRSSNAVIDKLGVEVVKGNIADVDDVVDAAKGCDYIIHIAAVTNQNLLKYDEYERINVGGCRNVIEAAEMNGVRRIVCVSTANTMGYGTLDSLGNEDTPMKYPFTESMYAKSKLEGQRLMTEAAERGICEVVIVNPTFMLGAYDSKPSSGKIVQMGYGKKLQFVPCGGKNFVYVGDAADGVCNALTMGDNGEKYLLSGENMSYKEFFALLGNITHTKTVFVKMPSFVLKGIGYVGNMLRALGIEVAISKANMDILCINNYFSNEKAKQGIALPETPIRQAVEETIDWFMEHKML